MKLLDKRGDIRRKQADRYRQQDNPEELADDVNASLSQQPLHTVGHLQHQIHPSHVEEQSNQNVNGSILRTEGEQRSERTCPPPRAGKPTAQG